MGFGAFYSQNCYVVFYDYKLNPLLWVFCLLPTLPVTHVVSCLTLTGQCTPGSDIQHWNAELPQKSADIKIWLPADRLCEALLSCQSLSVCQKKLCIIRQRTKRLNSHWTKDMARWQTAVLGRFPHWNRCRCTSCLYRTLRHVRRCYIIVIIILLF